MMASGTYKGTETSYDNNITAADSGRLIIVDNNYDSTQPAEWRSTYIIPYEEVEPLCDLEQIRLTNKAASLCSRDPFVRAKMQKVTKPNRQLKTLAKIRRRV
jgi:uncharacterized protein (DUF924 family)